MSAHGGRAPAGDVRRPAAGHGSVRRRRGQRVARLLGWVFVAAGTVVLLYLLYSLFFTGLQTQSAQRQLLEEFQREVGRAELSAPSTADRPPAPAAPAEEVTPASPGAPAAGAPHAAAADSPAQTPPEPAGDRSSAQTPPALGSAMAAMEFVRPGSPDRPPVHDGPLLVVEGVSRQALTQGPGHYPGTAGPGEDGNFAVAGHRTTYGAPLYHLDQLTTGDEVHVTDRTGAVHVYRFAERRIVTPLDVEVLGPDPLGSGKPILTLTTCHPRFSAAQRMVVFAELVT